MGKKYYSVWLVSLLFIVTACAGSGQSGDRPVLAGSIAVLLPDSVSSMRWEPRSSGLSP